MKKRLSVFLLIVVLILPIFAAVSFADGEDAAIPHIFDKAGVLSSDQIDSLEKMASSIAAEYQCAPYIVTIYDYSEFSSSIEQCALDMYDQWHLGYDNGNGDLHRDYLLLLISMRERDYVIDTCGYLGNQIFNNSGINMLENVLIPNLRNNDWYGGFSAFLQNAGELCNSPVADSDAPSQYASNSYGYEKPEGYEENNSRKTGGILATFLFPTLTAFAGCQGMKSKMKTTGTKTQAGNYLAGNGAEFVARSDVFINRTVQRQIIRTETKSESSGFSSGGHYSGGHSGHSGKF